MTKLLEEAMLAAQKLPAAEQDALAALILQEIADDDRWDAAFAKSPALISQLADKAREDIRTGRVRKASIDDL